MPVRLVMCFLIELAAHLAELPADRIHLQVYDDMFHLFQLPFVWSWSYHSILRYLHIFFN